MDRNHRYKAELVWTGNLGVGTTSYGSYERSYEIRSPGKAPIMGSSDPAFRGDSRLHNPEDLLAASVSACHMLWYLHLAASAGVVVSHYEDTCVGVLTVAGDGSGRFTEIILRPYITISKGDTALAQRLHETAHQKCFIANSVNFPIRVEPTITRASGAASSARPLRGDGV
jgi:organic hydroperoxide reductase OsmC/OhrA